MISDHLYIYIYIIHERIKDEDLLGKLAFYVSKTGSWMEKVLTETRSKTKLKENQPLNKATSIYNKLPLLNSNLDIFSQTARSKFKKIIRLR